MRGLKRGMRFCARLGSAMGEVQVAFEVLSLPVFLLMTLGGVSTPMNTALITAPYNLRLWRAKKITKKL